MSRGNRSRHTRNSLAKFPFSAQCFFFTLFPAVRPFADWVASSPLVSTISLLRSKSYSPIHELILLMSVQCTNPGAPYPSPVSLRPYIKSKYSYKFFNCTSYSWVYRKCSVLANATLHYDLWLSFICQTLSSSPPKGKSPRSLFQNSP